MPAPWRVVLRRSAFPWFAGGRCPCNRGCVRHRLYCHIVWRTRGNAKLLDARLARFLGRFFRAVARQERARVLEVGLVADHVHVLVRLHPEARISRLLQRFKGGSAFLARKEHHAAAGLDLRWSKGYTIESVSPRGLVGARSYVRRQPERHPDRAIVGWEGDVPEYDGTGFDEWRGEGRERVGGGGGVRDRVRVRVRVRGQGRGSAAAAVSGAAGQLD